MEFKSDSMECADLNILLQIMFFRRTNMFKGNKFTAYNLFSATVFFTESWLTIQRHSSRSVVIEKWIEKLVFRTQYDPTDTLARVLEGRDWNSQLWFVFQLRKTLWCHKSPKISEKTRLLWSFGCCDKVNFFAARGIWLYLTEAQLGIAISRLKFHEAQYLVPFCLFCTSMTYQKFLKHMNSAFLLILQILLTLINLKVEYLKRWMIYSLSIENRLSVNNKKIQLIQIAIKNQALMLGSWIISDCGLVKVLGNFSENDSQIEHHTALVLKNMSSHLSVILCRRSLVQRSLVLRCYYYTSDRKYKTIYISMDRHLQLI